MTNPDDPTVEGIIPTMKPPPVRREGVGIRAVVWGTEEGGRGGKDTVKGRRPQYNVEFKFIDRDQDHWGGAVVYRDPPPPPQQQTSTRNNERAERYRGGREGWWARVWGDQAGIVVASWIHAASEGSLFLMVAGELNSERRRRVGEGRG